MKIGHVPADEPNRYAQTHVETHVDDDKFLNWSLAAILDVLTDLSTEAGPRATARTSDPASLRFHSRRFRFMVIR